MLVHLFLGDGAIGHFKLFLEVAGLSFSFLFLSGGGLFGLSLLLLNSSLILGGLFLNCRLFLLTLFGRSILGFFLLLGSGLGLLSLSLSPLNSLLLLLLLLGSIGQDLVGILKLDLVEGHLLRAQQLNELVLTLFAPSADRILLHLHLP